MQTGKVRWFDTQKGFGLIEPDAGGSDVFVHITAVEHAGLKDLTEGQKVSSPISSSTNAAVSSPLSNYRSSCNLGSASLPPLFAPPKRPGVSKGIGRRS